MVKGDRFYALCLIPRRLPRRCLFEVALSRSSKGNYYLPYLARWPRQNPGEITFDNTDQDLLFLLRSTKWNKFWGIGLWTTTLIVQGFQKSFVDTPKYAWRKHPPQSFTYFFHKDMVLWKQLLLDCFKENPTHLSLLAHSQ